MSYDHVVAGKTARSTKPALPAVTVTLSVAAVGHSVIDDNHDTGSRCQDRLAVGLVALVGASTAAAAAKARTDFSEIVGEGLREQMQGAVGLIEAVACQHLPASREWQAQRGLLLILIHDHGHVGHAAIVDNGAVDAVRKLSHGANAEPVCQGSPASSRDDRVSLRPKQNLVPAVRGGKGLTIAHDDPRQSAQALSEQWWLDVLAGKDAPGAFVHEAHPPDVHWGLRPIEDVQV